jgi:glycosyltransferase involved in cell wall biosynthesis
MRIALIATDSRELERAYDRTMPAFGTAPEALLRGFEQIDGIEVHVISCLQRRTSNPEKIGKNLWYHGLHVPKIGWLRTGYQGCIRAVRKNLGAIAPDIVHGQGSERDCAISAVFSDLPNVVTIHGNMQEVAQVLHAKPFSFYWLAERLETFTLKRTAGVFCNSEHTRNLIKPRAQKTWLVPNALREIFFTASKKPSPHSVPLLLNVGVISKRKRQLELLQLAQRLHARKLKFKFGFVGIAPANDDYVQQFMIEMRQAEQAGYAFYHIQCEAQKLVDLFDASAALVHFPIAEPFGLVVAEALARDVKLFGARTGGISDIAVGVDDAELFDAADLPGLEDGIARWLEAGCPKTQSSAKIMADRYHPKYVAARHIEIYREVLASRKKE